MNTEHREAELANSYRRRLAGKRRAAQSELGFSRADLLDTIAGIIIFALIGLCLFGGMFL